MLRCSLCQTEMAYIHGHAACVRSGCPLYGANQAECCSGETAACGPLTAEVARGPGVDLSGASRPPGEASRSRR